MGTNQYYYIKGQKDYAAGRYEPPHGLLDDVLTWGSSGMRQNREENAAYEAGYGNAKRQGRR